MTCISESPLGLSFSHWSIHFKGLLDEFWTQVQPLSNFFHYSTIYSQLPKITRGLQHTVFCWQNFDSMESFSIDHNQAEVHDLDVHCHDFCDRGLHYNRIVLPEVDFGYRSWGVGVALDGNGRRAGHHMSLGEVEVGHVQILRLQVEAAASLMFVLHSYSYCSRYSRHVTADRGFVIVERNLILHS